MKILLAGCLSLLSAAHAETPKDTLLLSQSHLVKGADGKLKPGPAKLIVLSHVNGALQRSVIEDADSNVFHKALFWRGDLLTIGGTKAALKRWRRGQDGQWRADTLWVGEFGGRFDRLRDVEIGDVDKDGEDELVIATHDQGVVAIVDLDAKGQDISVSQQGRTPNTFIHEIELGDVDKDGQREIYCTPSGRNRKSGTGQEGGVDQYTFKDGRWRRKKVIRWPDAHAKEILVADLDGDGADELYAAREARRDGPAEVQIQRLVPEGDRWRPITVARLPDRQARFLVAGDVDKDGKIELIASTFKAGLWLLRPKGDGTFQRSLIDADSGGFEHAVHLADLDGDGQPELYVAADTQRVLRRYVWEDGAFARTEIAPILPGHITWNIGSR